MLITGVSGLLGSNLAYYFKDKYKVIGWYCSHPVSIDGIETQKADIVSDDLDGTISTIKPDIVVHCASLTNVDFCEQNKEEAKLINSIGTERLVNACSDSKIKFIYISTDAVYDGSKGNYKETDSLNPLSYYGITKLEGEQVTSKKPYSLILRTNIFGWNVQKKHSLGEWVIDQLAQGIKIKGFKDVYFSSIYTFNFASLLEKAINKDLSGIYNFVSSSSLSKYEFACRIAELFGFNKELIEPISVDNFPFAAKRSKNLTLNIDKLSNDLGVKIPTIEESVSRFHQDYIKGFREMIKSGQIKKEPREINSNLKS